MNTEEIKRIAKEKYGKELTDEQASQYAARIGKLSDEELDDVAGGGRGTLICLDEKNRCEKCGASSANCECANES